MKIFYDHQIFTLQINGGPSRYYCKLVNNLNKINVQAKIYAHFSSNNFICEIEKILKNHIKINDTFLKYATLKNKIFFLNTCLNYLNLKKFDPDIIHSTYYNINYLKEKKPVVVTVYDLIHEKFSKYYNKKSVWYPKKKMLDRSDHIICISENTKKDLKDIYGINDKKISTIYLATDIDKITTNKERVIKDKYILFVGNRHNYKNFKIFIKMLSKYIDDFKNFKVILFGGAKLSNSEKKFILDHKINLNIFKQIHGDDKILKNLYENAEFFIYPSLYEGFGLPILESWASGCPVLCSKTPTFQEIAKDAAVYFDPTDIDELYNKINLICSDKNLKETIINKGFNLLKNFSWQKCAVETENVYKTLI